MTQANQTFSVPSALPSITERQIVFVSHANPEDNAFATWLSLRLTREGYRVWCDVVRLRGGDDFWRDIETAIRQHTRKFIFVTSRASNQKQGTLQELAVATAVARHLNDTGFVVPVKIDDLPHADHNIQINRLNALTFTKGWMDGLVDLLKTLENDDVPRPEAAGPASVASWWNANRLNREIIKQVPESLWTNWFPLKSFPKTLWAWRVPDKAMLPERFHFPAYRVRDRLLSFADASGLTGNNESPTGEEAISFRPHLRREPPKKAGLYRHELLTAIKQLLRQAWHNMAQEKSLPLFELSSRRRTLWFPRGIVPGNTVSFVGVDGKKTRRDMCGYRTMSRMSGDKYPRYWHFGLEAVPLLYPVPVLALKSHVLFTLDGKTESGDAKFQHRARRGQCKDWWNDKWRDLTLAAVTWLTDGHTSLGLKLGPNTTVLMEWRPVKCRSDVSYDDADVRYTASEENREDAEYESEDSEDAEPSEAEVAAD
jgi:hypothetical protein